LNGLAVNGLAGDGWLAGEVVSRTLRYGRWVMVKDSGRVVTPYDFLTYRIIGAAMEVHRNLEPGMRENSYQRVLENRFVETGLAYEAQKLYEVYDDVESQCLVGYYVPDFVVNGTVVVEIKALQGTDNSHLAQVFGYLAVSGCPLGLLINFGERSLRHRRIFPPQNVRDHRLNRQWLFTPDWLRDSPLFASAGNL
jgi:GxxExxY protein